MNVLAPMVGKINQVQRNACDSVLLWLAFTLCQLCEEDRALKIKRTLKMLHPPWICRGRELVLVGDWTL